MNASTKAVEDFVDAVVRVTAIVEHVATIEMTSLFDAGDFNDISDEDPMVLAAMHEHTMRQIPGFVG